MTHPIDIPLRAADLWLRGASLGVRAALLPVEISTRIASAVLDRPAAPPEAPEPATRRRPARAKAKPPTRREVHPEPAPGLAEVHVAEPWEGYAALSAAEVVDRLADADETVRAGVRLYETQNEAREAVLHATEH